MRATEIQLPEAFKGADSFQRLDDRRIALGQQHLTFPNETRPDRAVILVSDDHWLSARIERQVDSPAPTPSAITLREGRPNMLVSRIETIGRPAERVSTYTLQPF